MKTAVAEALPQSDAFPGAPHPRETTELIGHAKAESQLLDAFRSRRLPHAWLIGGPEGIGKATLAWRFARFLLAFPDPDAEAVRHAFDLAVPADHPAVARIAAGATGDIAVLRREVNDKTGRFFGDIRVDDVRRAAGLFQRSSRSGGYRICIIDAAEDLNRNSANALLKLVEEPPERALFLIVAHRPAQVMPTLRSRCRTLLMDAPTPEQAAAAVAALGPPWNGIEAARLSAAAERAHGSIRGTLHWLTGERLEQDRDVSALLGRLPQVDWAGVHRLADRIGTDDEAFETTLASVLDWLHAGIRREAGAPGARVARLAEVWDNVRRSARDAQALNLDKRAFLFSIFADLAQSARRA